MSLPTPSGIGVDIVELDRIRNARFPERLGELFLSSEEQAELKTRTDKVEYLASRFAVKEAVIKAHPDPINFQDFEIRKHGKKPVVHFFDNRHNSYQVQVSLAHSTEYAAGYAVAHPL